MSVLGLDPLGDTVDVRGVPVESLPTTMGRYLGAVIDDAWSNSPSVWLGRAEFGAEEQMRARGYEKYPVFPGDPLRGDVYDYRPTTRPDLTPRLVSPDEANERAKAVGLTFQKPVPESFLEAQIAWRRRTLANREIFERIRADGNYGTFKWLAAGGTELLVSAADPLNLIASVMPVVGEARYAIMAARYGRVAAGTARGVIEGAVGNAVLEGMVAPVRAELDPDYTMAEAMINIAMGGALGGGLHLGGMGAGAAIDAVRGRLGARRAPGLDARGATERSIQAEMARFTDDAGPRPDVVARPEPPAMARAIEAVTPETRETAMRVALAQLHADRTLDVEPVLRLDPAWQKPDATQAGGSPRLLTAPHLLIDATQAESINAHAQLVARAFTDATKPAEPPADFTPSPEVADMVRRIRAGRGAYAQPREPQSLSQWIASKGGVMRGAEGAGELLAQDLGRLVRNKANGGKSLDDLALEATEAGFYPKGRGADGTITRPELAQFIDDIVADANRSRRTYSIDSENDLAMWRGVRSMNEEVANWLKNHLNVDPKLLSVRQLQYLLSLPEELARDQALLRRVQLVERMGEAESLEAVRALDAEIARAIEAEELRARRLLEERRQSLEPEEIDAELGHRLQHERPVTLDELEALHAERERLELAGRQGERAGEPGGRSGDGAQLQPDRHADPAAGAAAPEPTGRGRAQDARAQGQEAGLAGALPEGLEFRVYSEHGLHYVEIVDKGAAPDAQPHYQLIFRTADDTAPGIAGVTDAFNMTRQHKGLGLALYMRAIEEANKLGLRLSGSGSEYAQRVWTALEGRGLARRVERTNPDGDVYAAFEAGRATERTDQGDQFLLDGIRAITEADRARVGADAPLRGGDAPMPEGGLFDEGARNQADLSDWVRRQGDPLNDRHADADASKVVARDAAAPDLDPVAELAALMESDAKHLTNDDLAALEAAARPHDEMALAVEALAACRMGGANVD